VEWVNLTEEKQFSHEIMEGGDHIVFKHSNRCSISSMALKRLERSELFKNFNGIFWVLDVLQSRSLSKHLSSELDIRHESPQVIVFSNKRVIYDASHGGIDPEKINKLMP
jgi:bacillithiol system protein YtxJ